MVALAMGALTWQAHPGTLDRDLLLLTWLIVVEAGALLAMIDLTVHRLPTPLITAMTAGVAASITAAALVSRDPQLAIAGILAAAVMGGGYLLLALFTPSQVGMGDVRLAAVLGTALATGGWDTVLLGAVLPYLLAVPFAIAQIMRRRSTADGQVPFGPFLVAGAVLAATVAAF
jgi:leader peptidase (prepilin peptidase)/N-methyltransferase